VTSYPLVAIVARRLPAIPAKSLASERLFSKADDVIKSRFRFYSILLNRFLISNTGIIHHYIYDCVLFKVVSLKLKFIFHAVFLDCLTGLDVE